MAELSRRDLEAIEGFVRDLYRVHREQALIGFLLRMLAELVPCRQVSWNHVAPGLQRAEVMAWPEQPEDERYEEALRLHLADHPLIAHQRATGESRPIKLSDFVSQRKLHDSGLYADLYRGLRYEDVLAAPLAMGFAPWARLILGNDRWPFRERDRQVLAALQPHLGQALRQTRALERLARRLEAQRSEPAVTRLEVDARGLATDPSARAQRWLAWYFAELPKTPADLPDPVAIWLGRERRAQAGETIGRASAPLMVRRRGRIPTLRLVSAGEDGTAQLVLEEASDPDAPLRLADTPLTRRELEVLREVEKGARNRDIAAALGTSPATVKKHLERIYEKLAVDSRTAALAWLHERRRRGTRPSGSIRERGAHSPRALPAPCRRASTARVAPVLGLRLRRRGAVRAR